jgi:hypothetical protein
MKVKELENVEKWAVETFGAAELGDPRRTDRLVKVAAALGENPSVSLPRSMRNGADTQRTYRFLSNEAINHEQIMMPHWIQTRSEEEQRSQVLLIGDITDVNLSSHKATKGLGPVGRGKKAQGFFVHSVLAIDAKDKQLLSCLGQELFVREPAPEKETKAERKTRWRVSLIWEQSTVKTRLECKVCYYLLASLASIHHPSDFAGPILAHFRGACRMLGHKQRCVSRMLGHCGGMCIKTANDS